MSRQPAVPVGTSERAARFTLGEDWNAHEFAGFCRDIDLLYRYLNLFVSPTLAELLDELAPASEPTAASSVDLRAAASAVVSELSADEREARPLRVVRVQMASPGSIDFGAVAAVVQPLVGLVKGAIQSRDRNRQADVTAKTDALALGVKERLGALDAASRVATRLHGADQVDAAKAVIELASELIESSLDRDFSDQVVAETLSRAYQAAHRIGRDKRVLDVVVVDPASSDETRIDAARSRPITDGVKRS